MVVRGDGDGERHEMKIQLDQDVMVIATEPDPDRPWLGVLITKKDDGAHVNSVMSGSPAAKAGLEPGDVILRVGDRDVRKRGHENLLEGAEPGDRLDFVVERDGERLTLPVRLDSHPGRIEFPVDSAIGPLQIAGDVLSGIEGLAGLESLKGLSVLQHFDCDHADHDEDEPCSPAVFGFKQSIQKPRLGVILESLSPQLATFFEVPDGRGMLIKEVVEGSVAERSGLAAGDVILQIDDVEVAGLSDIRDALQALSSGDVTRIEVMRRGRREILRAEMDTDPPKQSGLFGWPSHDTPFGLHGKGSSLFAPEASSSSAVPAAAEAVERELRRPAKAPRASSASANRGPPNVLAAVRGRQRCVRFGRTPARTRKSSTAARPPSGCAPSATSTRAYS